MTEKTGNKKSAVEDLYPLTPLQQGLWFHELLDPAAGTYFVGNVMRIEGPLNRDAFRRAWEAVVARHAILRTRVVWEGLEQPLQLVQPRVELPWTEQDWRDSPAGDYQARLLDFLDADRVRGLDLAQAPLMRLTLCQVAEHSAILVWSFHHLILDRWSVDLVLQELWSAYEALVEGQPLRFRSLRPYRDYLAWLQGQDLDRAEHFWRQLLSGFTAPNVLGVDQSPHTTVKHREACYDTREITLSEADTSKLSQWARQQKLTVNTVVQGAWSLLLSRYSATEDVVFGATVSGRSAGLTGIESMVGLFINTLPVRVHVSPGDTLVEWLRELQGQQVTLREYEHTPLFEIQKWSEVPTGEPLFNTLLVFENTPLESGEHLKTEAAGLHVQRVDGRGAGETNYPLTVIVIPGGTLQLKFTYDTRHYTAEAVNRMVGHFQRVLAGMLGETGQQRLGAIPLLTEAECQQLLVDWNATKTPYPHDACIHDLFENQAKQTPDAVALVCGEDSSTYGELNTRANYLAQHLQEQYGVGPEVCVGVCMERSMDMVVGILGILKAGGAYVPLDPNYPPMRLAYILEDARVEVLITQERLVEDLPQPKATVICVDTDPKCLTSGNAFNPDSQVTAENLAYLIYTSGSTGKPKGVGVPHRNFVNLMLWFVRRFDLLPEDKNLLISSLTFDLTQKNIFAPLITGGTLVLPKSDVYDPPRILKEVAEKKITWLNCTPSAFYPVVQGHGSDSYLKLSSVRYVFLGGEPISLRKLQHWIESSHFNATVVNTYGPTECSDVCSSYEIDDPKRFFDRTVPIGKPIDNTQLYVVRDDGQLVPVGVEGELCVGGEGVARGYYHQPALTADKFIPNPFSQKPGARLYKTGDVARYLADGTIQFLGRVDHQVKIRGYRIELGEIEEVLGQLPQTKDVVVVVRDASPEDKRVVAYVVPSEGPLSSRDLRQILKQRLPEYMVPAHFVMLDALPLTPNGKVDRKALPDPDGSWTDLVENFVPPRKPEEANLARIWKDILGVEQVGVHDNFFECGGHSLLATQAVSRVYQAFEVEVPLRVFFENPTIAGIAAFLANAASASQPFARPQLVPVSRERQLPLSFAQERLWLLEQLDPGSTAYSMPAALRLSGSLNVSALEESLSQLVLRHEVLRTHYAFIKEEAVQIITPVGDFSLPIIDLEDRSPDEQASALRQQIQEEHNRPFDLGQGPLFRVTLLRLAPAEHVFLLILHHSIADGLSIDILYREVATGYEAACHGKAGHQRPLPIQYADYAVWQRQWLQGAALDGLLTYWTEQLADAPRQLDLPADFPRPPAQTHRGAHHAVQLPESVVSSLRALSQSEGVTMFMSLLAAFALVLSRHTGQEDIVVGTPVANRPRAELEGMIGHFLNTLVLRTRLSGDPTFRELIRRVREVCLGAYAHQELPFERLVEALQPERDLSRTPLFQVFLNLVDLSETTLNLPGLTVARLERPAEAAKFDLTLYVFLNGTSATVQWSYNRDLFDASTIAWMAEHFHTVLMHLPEILDHPISSVSLLRKEDRARLRGPTDLVCPSEPFVAFPETALEQSLPARFEEQAHERPDQLAVHTAQYQWTYGAINGRANQIAHTLLSRRLPAGARVALLFAHDAPMVAAVLGVLKAGYTYVPLDPFFPPARLESIVTDAGALAVLTEPAYLPLARKLGEAVGQVLTLDEAFAQAKTSDPQHRISPDTLAYILYTSGTTGVPKGVMQSHRHVLHHIRVYTNNLHLRAEDRLTLLTPYGFDAAVMNLYGALLNGACLYPLDLREADPATIPAWMEQHAITIYHSTPTVYRYWTRTLEEGPTLPACRMIVLGGEAATRADFEAYRRHFGRDCLFVNGLGPTESTVSLQFVADHSTEIIGQTMPVGYPVEHTEIALLDQDGKETEVYGEIAIRSPYVAVGYWHQPELTQKAFDSPLEPRGARLYRTGDMGRRRFDGSLEFMGRKDTQVKIRGFRIEVREIEFVLGQHPAIGGIVVVTGEDRHGDTHLVAYLVINEAPSPSISDIRSFLKQKLPEYMVPSAFMFMDALPRTPNGKVDYRSLPMPDFERSQLETKYVAPRTPVEKALAKIWGQVLALERVGVHDNFFELGGHSLQAAQVVSRTRDNFGIELPLLRVFETPTIAGLTELIEMIRLADQGPLSDHETTASEWDEGEL